LSACADLGLSLTPEWTSLRDLQRSGISWRALDGARLDERPSPVGGAPRAPTRFWFSHQPPKISGRQVGVAHHRPEVRVAHGHLDVRRVLSLGEPSSHTAVTQVMLMQLVGETSTLHCIAEGISQ
jgi:hypothetical protein